MKLSHIIPAHNEEENLKELVVRVSESLKNFDYELILIDDKSSDQTSTLAKKLSQDFPIRLISLKTRKGLALAVIEGIKLAEGEILGVMDADLQHPPELLPQLLEKILQEKADIAIASRYLKEANIKNWSFQRKFISKIAIILAKIFFLNLRKIKDPLSGFFLFKKSVIRKISFHPVGFKILLEILVLGNYKKIEEVPYFFEGRKKGKSKLNLKEKINYLLHLYSLLKRKKFYKNY